MARDYDWDDARETERPRQRKIYDFDEEDEEFLRTVSYRPRPSQQRPSQQRRPDTQRRPASAQRRPQQGQRRPSSSRPAPRRRRGSVGGLVLSLLVIAAVAVVWLVTRGPVHSVTIEAGSGAKASLFVDEPAPDTAFMGDVSSIDTAVPGKYKVQILHNGKVYDTTLKVKDTVAPVAVAKRAVLPFGIQPDPAACVEGVQDVTAVTASWKKAPDPTVTEEQTAVVRLTDAGGNRTDVTVQVLMSYDTTAPVIEGAKDIKAFVGGSIAYRDGVTVTDDADPDPTLTIDNSAVNINAAGTYPATYTATDAVGNSSSVTVTVTVGQKPANYVEEEQVYEAAQEIYDQIVKPGMTDMEKAYAIYHWVKDYIYYVDQSSHEYWTVAAYQAFTEKAGDCFTYYAAAKAMLNMAGIQNTDVEKSDISHSRHYWLLINLGYGWYHYDACPRVGPGDDNFFMLTDAELAQYSNAHGGTHVFDPTLYPERATESVQSKVDYENNRVYG